MNSSTPAGRNRTPAAKNPARAPVAPGVAGFPSALVRATLDRILESAVFRRSPRHRLFLDHLVRTALEGDTERLKEVFLGVEIFDRTRASFDPRRDPIVRVEAGRVREKLARYYETEGGGDRFELGIRVGSYVPHLKRRDPGTHAVQKRCSLAVLPFHNLSGAAEDAALCTGLTDELIDTLGRAPGLKVVARMSSFKAREKAGDVRAVGKLLGVETVLEGSVQCSGARVRCIVQWSRTRDGFCLWSRRFDHDRETSDLFAFQDAVAHDVFAAVNLQLEKTQSKKPRAGAERFVSLTPVVSSNPAARDLFERSRYMTQQGTIPGYRKAIDLLEKAIAIDPAFAQAHSHLGAARANLAPFVFDPPIPSFAKVKHAALRALELDPLDGDAHALLAIVAYRVEANWTVAEPMFREALRVAPNSTLAHTAFTWGLVFNGHFAEAIEHARIALELDPLNLAVRAHNARLYSYARHYELAIAELQGVLDLEPGHLYSRLVLGMIHLSLGDHEAAMPYFEAVASEMPEHSSAHFQKICVYGMRGEIARGRRELDALLKDLEDVPYSPFNLALAQTCLGDRESAYASLEKAARIRDYLFVSAPAHVLFDRYHGDPAFVALLRRHGLDLLPTPIRMSPQAPRALP